MLLPSDKIGLEIVLAVASICIPIISTTEICVAVWAIRANRRAQREQTARNAHLKHIELTIAHWTLAIPDPSQLDFNKEMYNGTADEFDRYEWFVSFLLSTASYVWESVGREHSLARLMRLQIAYHWPYIEHFKDKRDYSAIWYDAHKEDIDEGLALGKAHYQDHEPQNV